MDRDRFVLSSATRPCCCTPRCTSPATTCRSTTSRRSASGAPTRPATPSTATPTAWRPPPARSGRGRERRRLRPRRVASCRRSSIATDVSVVDHYTYFIAGDGCLMEGISHEAASFAGHFKLGKLIGFFDDNSITIDGRTDLTCSDDAAARFASYGWQVLHLARRERPGRDRSRDRRGQGRHRAPHPVITKTIIGFGSPNRADTAKAHGEPLGAAEIVLTKDVYAWPSHEPFHVPAEAVAHWRTRWPHAPRRTMRGAPAGTPIAPDTPTRGSTRASHAGRAAVRLGRALPAFNAANGSMASRAASGACSTRSPPLPELLGGSADLTGIQPHAAQGRRHLLRGAIRPAATCTTAFASTPWAPS
jgi:transketolase